MTIQRVRHRADERGPGSLHWWLTAQGLIGFTVGLLAISFPTVTVMALALLLGLGLTSLGAVGFFLRGRSPVSDRWRGAVFATVSLVAGLLCLFRPVVGVLALLFGLVLWFFVVGVNDLVHVALERSHRAWNVALGALSLGVAVGLATHPDAAVHSLALLAGLGFCVRGALDIGLAVALSGVEHRACVGEPQPTEQ